MQLLSPATIADKAIDVAKAALDLSDTLSTRSLIGDARAKWSAAAWHPLQTFEAELATFIKNAKSQLALDR